MKYTLNLIFGLMICCLVHRANGQDKSTGTLIVEPHVGYLFAAGKVNISSTGTAFINSLYPGNLQNQINEKDHDGNYLNLGVVFARQLSQGFRLGLGADADFYFNIGDRTRYTLPVYVNAVYSVPTLKAHLFVFASGGYAPGLSGEWHNGAKAEGGLGYGWKGKQSGNRYAFSLSYNYQQLRGVSQYVFATSANGATNILSGVNSVNLNVNSIPLKFSIAF